MQFHATESFISRNDAIRQLSRIRYPLENRDIDPSTLFRWRKLARVGATKQFNAEDFGRLCRVAQFAFQGFTYNEIAAFLGVASHDPVQRPAAQTYPSQPPEPEPATASTASDWLNYWQRKESPNP